MNTNKMFIFLMMMRISHNLASSFAVNDAGRAQPNQYGLAIYNDGKSIIDSLWNGDLEVQGLTRVDPTISVHPTRPFREVGGLRTQGQVDHNYYGDTDPDRDFLGEGEDNLA